jgi:hypothetical protein
MEEAWGAVVGGARQVVFIGAEPGAGKSRLAAKVCAELHRLGASVLIGTCVAELGPPYQPFEDPVESLRAGVITGSLLTGDPDRWPASAVAEKLGTIVGRERPDSRDHLQVDDRREMYNALVGVIQAACEQRPLVLLLEDLHWAGSTSLQLLTYLIERTAQSRLLVLVTHRTTAPDRSGELVRQIASLYRLDGVRRLDLAPLDTEDIAEFLVREGKVPRSRARPAAVVLRDQTGGNPFFLREVWLDLERRGGLGTLRAAADAVAPEVVAEMVQQRIAGLPSTVRHALGVAAVIGEEVEAATLLAVVGRDEGLTALDALVGIGLTEAVAGSNGAYRFLHALARQAVLDRLPSLQRAQHHEQVAVVLEERGGRVEQLAHHYAAAHLLGHAEKAVHYLVEAARVADRSLAYAEAARLLERAAGLCRGQFEREEHLLSAARNYHLACEFDRSRELLLTIATKGDPGLRLRAATAFEEAAWFIEDSGHRALDLLKAAVQGRRPDPSDHCYVRAVAGMARAMALSGAHEQAESLVAQAIEMARATGDTEVLGDVLSASMQVGFRPWVNTRKMQRALELSDLAGKHGPWVHLGPAAYHRAVIAYQNGDTSGLSSARRDLELTCEFAGQKYWWSYMGGCIDFGALLAEGRLTEAERFCRSLLDLGESFSPNDADGPYGVQLLIIRSENCFI